MGRPASAEVKTKWEAIIRQQEASGLSIKRWCRQHQVHAYSVYYWKRRLKPNTQVSRSCFTELVADEGTGIVIEYQGVRIVIDRSFDPTTLRNCLSALRGIQC